MATPNVSPHFLVISLGNRKPYLDTLHSVGHFGLLSLQKTIANRALESVGSPSETGTQEPWTKVNPENPTGRLMKNWASYGSKYTLLQSPVPMNLSGGFVADRWAKTLEMRGLQPWEMGLVIVHDDLEESFASVRVREWESSHRGHNGVKSVLGHMRVNQKRFTVDEWRRVQWARISVGIDRPESRENSDVAKYVLSQLKEDQKNIIDAQVGPKILACLEQLDAQWQKLR